VNRQDLLDLVGSKSFRERGIHDPKGVDGYVREHLSGQKNHHQYLWQLVNTELWMRRFFDR
jgi:hypothetical protein